MTSTVFTRYAATNCVDRHGKPAGAAFRTLGFKEGEAEEELFDIQEALQKDTTNSKVAGEGFTVETTKKELVKALDKNPSVYRAGGVTEAYEGNTAAEAATHWVEPKKMVPPVN